MGTTAHNLRHTEAERLLLAGKRGEAERYIADQLARTDLSLEERTALLRTQDWLAEAAPTLTAPRPTPSQQWIGA